MADIQKLIQQLAAQEEELHSSQFIAPCVGGGKVRTRLNGMVYTFTPQPRNFEGWGIFQAVDGKRATVTEEPSLPQIAEYLQYLKPLRLRLAYKLQRQTWLAYPVNEGDMEQRCGYSQPVAVHLVSDGNQFDTIVARTDGVAWWFDECDRRADPLIAVQLREHLQQVTIPEEVQFKGMTPEMGIVYDLATQQAGEFAALNRQKADRKRLEKALKMGGGELQEFSDRQDRWLVQWTTRDGEHHTSAISKNDLTVISAGICLSNEDEKFDLQSLVGVIEDADNF
ncbi:MAG: hypothetical protein QNJ51_03155 [Calothrix sp. MO_167.B12]|nr:hypothetical protein [Calothrix sp. MO_167.B12]